MTEHDRSRPEGSLPLKPEDRVDRGVRSGVGLRVAPVLVWLRPSTPFLFQGFLQPLSREWPGFPSPRASYEHDYTCSFQARSCFSSLGGLVILDCAQIFHPAHPLADIFHPPYPPIASQSFSRDVPLAQARPFQSTIFPCLSLGEWPRLPFTARIERPLFHRGGSASKKGAWPLPSIFLRARVRRAGGRAGCPFPPLRARGWPG